jgi:hypothetical protein
MKNLPKFVRKFLCACRSFVPLVVIYGQSAGRGGTAANGLAHAFFVVLRWNVSRRTTGELVIKAFIKQAPGCLARTQWGREVTSTPTEVKR